MVIHASLYELFSIRHDEKITVTLRTGEKVSGRVQSTDEALYDTVVENIVLILGPEYGKGNYHRILGSEIVMVTKSL